jgi:hypothetical protein
MAGVSPLNGSIPTFSILRAHPSPVDLLRSVKVLFSLENPTLRVGNRAFLYTNLSAE